jgi:hypothetical protein
MQRKFLSSLILGVMFIICGGLFLFINLFVQFVPGFSLNWGVIWPIFLFIPSLMLFVIWIVSDDRPKAWGVLIPATILFFLSGTFLLNTILSTYLHYGQIWAWTTFMYPFSVGLAFWVAWLASGRRHGLLVPAIILTLVSLIILCASFGTLSFFTIIPAGFFNILWPMVIIGVGVIVLVAAFVSYSLRSEDEFMGKDKEEWKKWGEDFGAKMETAGKKFGSKMEKLGEEFGESMEDTFKPGDEKENQKTESRKPKTENRKRKTAKQGMNPQ